MPGMKFLGTTGNNFHGTKNCIAILIHLHRFHKRWMRQHKWSVAWGSSTMVLCRATTCWSSLVWHAWAVSASSTNCWMMHQCQEGTAAQYLTAHWLPLSATASRQHLRLASSRQLTVLPHRRVTYGGWAFAVTSPSIWNSPPKHLCDPF